MLASKLVAPGLVLAALAPSALAQFELIGQAGNAISKGFMRKVLRFNESTIERVMTQQPILPVNEYAVDINDDQYEAVLKTGSTNPLALPLPEDTIWVITVYGADAISKVFANATDSVAMFNSSEAGGVLPKNMRFARLDYGSETILTTRWNLWKPPVLVIGTNKMQDLRFFKIGHVAPYHEPMAELLENRELWETMPIWRASYGPGGSLEPYIIKLGEYWSSYHRYVSKVPNFVLLILSGALMNLVVGWFHTAKTPEETKTSLTKDERRKALKDELDRVKAERAATAKTITADGEASKIAEIADADTEEEEEDSEPQSTSSAVKPKGKTSRRK